MPLDKLRVMSRKFAISLLASVVILRPYLLKILLRFQLDEAMCWIF